MHRCDLESGLLATAIHLHAPNFSVLTAHFIIHILIFDDSFSLLAGFDILVAFCTIVLALSFILFPSGQGTGLSHFLLYNEQVLPLT